MTSCSQAKVICMNTKQKNKFKKIRWLFGKEIEIPQTWNVQKIESLVNVLDSQRIPINSDERKKIPGNIPYYGANGIQDYVGDYIFDEELILLAEDGGYFEEYKTRPIAQYIIGKCWINNHTHVLNAKNNTCLKFVFYSLVHKNILPYINGSTRTKLNQFDLRQISVLIPSYTEQQKIASILSGVDASIEATQKVVEKAETLKKGLMQKLLTRGIGHTKFKKVRWLFGKEIEIPEEWELTRLRDNCTMYVPMRDKPKKFDGNIPWLRIEDLDGKFVSDTKSDQYVSNETVKKMNLKIYPIGTVLCSCSATIGVCAITTEELITNQTFIGIYSNSRINNEFLYYYLNTQKNNLIKLGSGSTILYISRKKFEDFKIVLPSLPEQQKIASILSGVDAYIQKNQEYKKKLERLKKGLMQKLLTGQIRVSV